MKDSTIFVNGKKVKLTGTAELFNNNFLELFTRTSWLTAVSFYLILIILLVISAVVLTPFSALSNFFFYLIGFVSWTLLEYILHRYVFHISENHPIGNKISYMLHGVHHEYPRDHSRLFMPPLPGTILLAMLYGFFYLIMKEHAVIFLAGILNGYLLYSFLHFSMHRFSPPKPLKKLWAHHAMHHFRDDETAFGVSSTFWDRVFRTMPVENQKGRNTSEKR